MDLGFELLHTSYFKVQFFCWVMKYSDDWLLKVLFMWFTTRVETQLGTKF